MSIEVVNETDVDVDVELVASIAGPDRVHVVPHLVDALSSARELCEVGDAVIVTGSITLVGDTIDLAKKEGWS